jgi:hypothetical protein
MSVASTVSAGGGSVDAVGDARGGEARVVADAGVDAACTPEVGAPGGFTDSGDAAFGLERDVDMEPLPCSGQ